MLVVAGPGSGKTTVITRRIDHLVRELHIPPENILVITFTKASAIEMKERYLRLCKSNWTNVNFGTFHSIFFQILRQESNYSSKSILTKREKTKILLNILQSGNYAKNKFCSEEQIAEYLSKISNEKNKINILNKKSDTDELENMEEQDIFQFIMQEYERRLAAIGKLDFDDLIIKCYELLEREPRICVKYQKQFRYILIDEFQDINQVQYQIMKRLSAPDNNIFVVGDDDQSIYAFRGACPEMMKQFLEEYQAKQINLSINYRSNSQIVTLADQIISQNTTRLTKTIISGNENKIEKEAVRIFATRTSKEQYLAIAKILMENMQQDKTCAILCRNRKYMEQIAIELRENNISFTLSEEIRSINQHFIKRDLSNYARFIYGERTEHIFMEIRNIPMRYLGKEHYQKNCKEWNDFIHEIEFAQKLPLYLCFHYVVNHMGYGKYLEGLEFSSLDKKEENKEVLKLLMDSAKDCHNLEEWMNFWEKEQEDLEGKSGKEKRSEMQNSVKIMTIHGSKGLEFDLVIISDVNEGILPSRKAKTIEQIEEERRIFYVGITRAKEEIYLLYVENEEVDKKIKSRFLDRDA